MLFSAWLIECGSHTNKAKQNVCWVVWGNSNPGCMNKDDCSRLPFSIAPICPRLSRFRWTMKLHDLGAKLWETVWRQNGAPADDKVRRVVNHRPAVTTSTKGGFMRIKIIFITTTVIWMYTIHGQKPCMTPPHIILIVLTIYRQRCIMKGSDSN